jgi:hypothetical protein
MSIKMRHRFRGTLIRTIGALLAMVSHTALRARVSEGADLWGTDGNVVAAARAGNTLYIAGAFSEVGPVSGGGVPIDAVTGVPIAGYSRIAGAVRAVVSDGAGGWYVGGKFAGVGDVAAANLAHLGPEQRPIPAFDGPDGEVLALALNDSVLYVGGAFQSIGGVSRSNFAEVDIRSGRTTELNVSVDGTVRSILAVGGRLLLAGDFTSIDGVSRMGVAQIDLNSRQLAAWNPSVSYFGNPASVHALAANGDMLYLGGAFWNVGLLERRGLAAVDLGTGLLSSWNPGIGGPDEVGFGDPYIEDICIQGNLVFVGGHFDSIGGRGRDGLACIDRLSGEVTEWSPDPGSGAFAGGDVYSIVPGDTTLFIAGGFTSLGGQPRKHVGEVGITSGLATEWNPSANDFGVMALARDRTVVFIGGTFLGIGPDWKSRHNLAALDALTGELKAWDPDPDGLIVNALVVAHGHVFVGGHFSRVGTENRFGLAELDTLSGLATAWSTDANGAVLVLRAAQDTLFVGGQFTSIAGTSRPYLASFDLGSGAMTAWNPQPNGDVFDLELRDRRAYVCGFFNSIGGELRDYAAAVDVVTGLATPWDPRPDGPVEDLLVHGETVIAAGGFTQLGGELRSGFAIVDGELGMASTVTADINSSAVYALAAVEDTVFVGGTYSMIGGTPRRSLAAVDVNSGDVLAWDPDLGVESYLSPLPTVWSLVAFDRDLYAGGTITRAGLKPAASLANFVFGRGAPIDPTPQTLLVHSIWPNPISRGGSAKVRLALPRAAVVSLSLSDVQGRRVAAILGPTGHPAGTYDFPLPVSDLRPGFYFCRIEVDGVVRSRKFVVIG